MQHRAIDRRSPLRPRRQRPTRWLAITAVGMASLVAAGCGSEGGDDDGRDTGGATGEDATLVVYSGREQELVEPLYELFEERTDIQLDVRYAESPQLAAQMQEEGDRTPADVFFAQDAGAIGSVEELLAPLPDGIADEVPEAYRDDEGRWTGVTARARTLVYNTDEVESATLPQSVLDLTEPEWKGRIGVAPTNSSFIGFVTAMRQDLGDERTLEWLEGIAANSPETFEKNGAIVEAVASGEVEVGLVNHYYLYEALGEDESLPIANHFFADGDPGNFVNVSAIGIVDGTEHEQAARELVSFLLTDGQTFIVEDAPEREYPLDASRVEDSERYQELPPLADIDGPDVELGALGDELEATVELIDRSGLQG